ncbi:hypothetical protein L2E82_48584 [Cichorium intybus]|uniref:Uncharacterized protein n=1 Tax=Cichorium intybus TaxID=13427 RepID=A0ACB8YXP7_CICIN|nr:hypothetical protein L2E82_48584 [Cichorium intybus]
MMVIAFFLSLKKFLVPPSTSFLRRTKLGTRKKLLATAPFCVRCLVEAGIIFHVSVTGDHPTVTLERNYDYVQLLGVRNSKLTTCRSLNLKPLRIFSVTFDYIANSNSNFDDCHICLMRYTMQSNFAANSVNPSALLDFTNGEDWHEELYEKIKIMKNLYLQDLNDMNLVVFHKLQQHNSVPQQPNNEKIEKLKVFNNAMERFMAFLQIPKCNILPIYKEKLSTYEDQIVHVINSNRQKLVPNRESLITIWYVRVEIDHQIGDWRHTQLQADSRKRIMNRIMDTLRSHMQVYSDEGLQELTKIAVSIEEEVYIAATSQSDYMRKICFKILTIETRSLNLLPYTMHSNFAANSVNPSDFTNGEDWQEEVYEKIKIMKNLYLQDLNDLYLVILHKLQKHNSVPQQQLNNEKIEKLKAFKNMLERFMTFLQIPKHNILAKYKDKLSTYEDQIVRVIYLNRRKPVPNQ